MVIINKSILQHFNKAIYPLPREKEQVLNEKKREGTAAGCSTIIRRVPILITS